MPRNVAKSQLIGGIKVTPQSNGNAGRIQRGTYLESSGGLLLNVTFIITGTSKDTEQDLETAKRLKNNAAIKSIELQVRSFIIIFLIFPISG